MKKCKCFCENESFLVYEFFLICSQCKRVALKPLLHRTETIDEIEWFNKGKEYFFISKIIKDKNNLYFCDYAGDLIENDITNYFQKNNFFKKLKQDLKDFNITILQLREKNE
jgi:hypothetical protein